MINTQGYGLDIKRHGNAVTSGYFSLEAVHKRHPQSWGRGFVQCGHFADKGFFNFLAQKTSDFSKFMVCPQRQGI